MRKILFIITSLFAMLQISCVEKSGYYSESENRIIDLICDITWMSEKTTNDKGMTYQDVYKFSKNGTYARTLIATDKNGKEQQSAINGQWTFSDPSFGIIYFGHNDYWDIDELTEKKFSAYRRSGEFGELGMTREYFELSPKE